MKRESAKRNLLNLPHLPPADLNLLLKCRRFARADVNFKILRRLQKPNLKAVTQNVNLNRSVSLAEKIGANRLNLKFAAQLLSSSQVGTCFCRFLKF